MVCLIRGSSPLADQCIEYLAAFDVVSASLPEDPFVAYYTPPAKFTRKSRCVQRGGGALVRRVPRPADVNAYIRAIILTFYPELEVKNFTTRSARVFLGSNSEALGISAAERNRLGTWRRGRARRNSSTQWSARPRAQ